MVQPENGLDHFSYPASIAQRQSRRNSTKYQRSDPNQPWRHSCTHNHDDNNAFHLTPVRLRHEAPQGGDHMPRIRKTSRQFEKDKATFFNQCKTQHAVCWLCGMPIDYAATKNTTDDSFNLDHLYPVSKHPELQFDPAGFKPSHTSCNRLRSNQDPPTPIGTLSRQWINTSN